MKNTNEFKVIGTATIDIANFRAFRASERQKAATTELCWPAAIWQSYFYKNQDLYKYAEVGYCNCTCLHHTPKDSFDKQIEKTCQYLETMGLEWDLMFRNDIIAIVKYGNIAFGLPTDQNIIECHMYANLDDFTLSELRGQIGAGNKNDGIAALIPNGEISKNEMKNNIAEMECEIEKRQKDIKALEEQQRQEVDRIEREIRAKYKEQFDLIEKKKLEMEEKIRQMKNQLFILDTGLYAIRCWMGETVKFTRLCSGKHAEEEMPVILYQKLRYLDEEMGKWLSLYDFNADDQPLFEEAIKYRQDLRDLFSPPDKSISLIRVSRNRIQYGDNPDIANMLKEYETYHGNQIGILLRDGENVWIGWTDVDRVDIIDENAFFKTETIINANESVRSSTKEEVASRYFVFSILQGILSRHDMIILPEGASVFKNNPYVVYSMADGCIEDNRYGTFSDIVERIGNQPMMVGDMVLTTLTITRDDRFGPDFLGRTTYQDAWNNDRGRGEANRTHDAHIPNRTVLPVNLIDVEEIYTITFDKYKCEVEEVPDEQRSEKSGFPISTIKSTRTNQLIGDHQEYFSVINGYYENFKKEEYNLKGMSEDEIYAWYLQQFSQYTEHNHIDIFNKSGYFLIPKGVKKVNAKQHIFLSAKKEGALWRGTNANANMKIESGEYLPLTYLNSVYIRYAIQNRKIGGWQVGGKIMDYANSLSYLNTALDYLKKREDEEARLLSQHMDLYPDWQVDLSEWRLRHRYHRLTDRRAKKFAQWRQAQLQEN